MFADTVRRSRYIGACYGSPGIGKTLSARTYAAADDWDWWSTSRHLRAAALPTSLLESRTVMWTPHVITTPRQLEQQIAFRCSGLNDDIQAAFHPDWDPEMTFDFETIPHTELLIVDEAERLKTQGLEQLRDFFDRNDIGLILIGMPGFEKQLARYPQLYSRIGFAHQYRPLEGGDVIPVLALYWSELGPARVQTRLNRHRRGRPGDHPHHRRQLPPHRTPDGPSRPDHEHQRTLRHHR